MSAPLWTSAEAAAATGGASTREWAATGVSIDSRTVKKGDLFVALRACVAAGRIEEARRLQAMANRVIQVLIKVGVMPGSKALLGIMDLPGGASRRPFRKVEEADLAALREAVGPVLAWRESASRKSV